MAKKYYWLKLPENFFKDSKPLKKLRKIAGGDTYTIIYLKMLLASLKNDGLICLEGLEEKASDEIALELDEDPDNVAMTVQFLFRAGLLEERTDAVYLPQVKTMVGSEADSTKRVREHRERKKQYALQCNTAETKCNTEIEIEIEKEIEKEKDIELEKEREIDSKKHKRFTPPTLDEVIAYCRERNNNVDAIRWYDYYSANGWKVGKNSMKDWKASVRTWERNSYSSNTATAFQKTAEQSDLDDIF